MLKLNAIPLISSLSPQRILHQRIMWARMWMGVTNTAAACQLGQLTNKPNNINLVQNSLWTHDMRPFVSLLYLLKRIRCLWDGFHIYIT